MTRSPSSPADAVEVEYRDANNKVVDLKDAGLYTARIVSKSEASNYLVNYKFANLKVSESKVFSDVQTSDWFYNAVFNAKKLRLHRRHWRRQPVRPERGH